MPSLVFWLRPCTVLFVGTIYNLNVVQCSPSDRELLGFISFSSALNRFQPYCTVIVLLRLRVPLYLDYKIVIRDDMLQICISCCV